MSDLLTQTFQDNHPVRIVMRDGEPWFVGNDVCSILEINKPRNSLAKLDDDEKDAHTVGTPGGDQDMTIISESGLYSLVLRSRKAEAKQFRKWITAEVLPSIRKTGSYSVENSASSPSLTDPETLRQLLLAQCNTNLGLQRQANTLERITQAEADLCLSDAAKVLGIGSRALIEHLHAESLIFKRPGNTKWIAKQHQIDSGNMKVKLHSFEHNGTKYMDVLQTFITPRGVAMIDQQLHG